MLCQCCDSSGQGGNVEVLGVSRSGAAEVLEAVRAASSDDCFPAPSEEKGSSVKIAVPGGGSSVSFSPPGANGSSGTTGKYRSAMSDVASTSKTPKSINFDQTREEIQIQEVVVEQTETTDAGDTEPDPSAALRAKFGGRSATSRAFELEKASTWNLETRETIDPKGGLRRNESVAISMGDIHSKYKIEQKLGEGSFGTVMKISDLRTHQVLALKIIPVANLKDSQRFEQELAISRRLKHPNIIVLHETFMEGSKYHLCMEMCRGGDLYDRIMARAGLRANGPTTVGLDWQTVARYAWQMLTGVAYMHLYRFVHRDIKPENFLLSTQSPDATIKLIDFGLARECKKGEKMKSRVGTPHYVAPEVVSESSDGYLPTCDVWSIGVTLWFISVGTLPFMGKDQAATLRAVVKAKYDFSNPVWNLHGHPEEIRQLIGELMMKDPQARPSAKQVVQNNAWLKQNAAQAVKKTNPCCTIG